MAKILLIDDDPVTQLYCKRILEKENYEVESSTDAMEGIKKARNDQFKIIIVDLVLPGPMNGIDVIKSIRDIYSDVTIIAYSGFSDIDIKEKVMLAGADNFITKPFKPVEFIAALQPKNFVKSVYHNSDKFKLKLAQNH